MLVAHWEVGTTLVVQLTRNNSWHLPVPQFPLVCEMQPPFAVPPMPSLPHLPWGMGSTPRRDQIRTHNISKAILGLSRAAGGHGRRSKQCEGAVDSPQV